MTRNRKIAVSVAVAALVAIAVLVVAGQSGRLPGSTPPAPTTTVGASTAAPTTGGPASVPVGSATPVGSTPTPRPAPSASPSPRPPLPIESTAAAEQGSTVAIVSKRSVTSTANGPGDIAGPAVQITIEITAGAAPVDLSEVVVNAYYGEALTPAQVGSGPDVVPFTGSLQPGEKASATFVFNVPTDQRDLVTVDVFYDATQGQIRFRGTV